MFTGIVEEVGRLRGLTVGERSAVLEIEASVLDGTRVGDSIATAAPVYRDTAHRRPLLGRRHARDRATHDARAQGPGDGLIWSAPSHCSHAWAGTLCRGTSTASAAWSSWSVSRAR